MPGSFIDLRERSNEKPKSKSGIGREMQWGSKVIARESFPRQVDKESGVPKERGVWNSQGGRKDKLFFLLYIP